MGEKKNSSFPDAQPLILLLYKSYLKRKPVTFQPVVSFLMPGSDGPGEILHAPSF